MNAIDLKRVEFRHYLETSGVMDALSYALIKLYDEIDKPNDPVAFVRTHFKRPNDELDISDLPKRIEDMNATELIKKQQQELKQAQQEITKLQQMLNAMSSNSFIIESTENETNVESNTYQHIFNDPKYDGTLIKKYLTEDLFDKLFKLPNEHSIVDCIAKVDTLDNNPFGVIALSANCYTAFKDLFEPIVKEIHCLNDCIKQPECDWGDANVFEKISTESIQSIEISCSRSLTNHPFIPNANEQDLQTILTTVQNAIQSAQSDDNEIDGEFYKITDIKENEPIFNELKKCGLGFRSMDSKDHHLWPIGRALYINGTRTQSILINECEHLRFISKEMNSDLGLAYKGLIELIRKFGEELEFQRHNTFGWLTTNLQLLGTGIYCKAQLKLQFSEDYIKKVANQTKMKIHSINSSEIETDEDNKLIVELTNWQAFGISEFECVKLFYDGIKDFIQKLENNEVENVCVDMADEIEHQKSDDIANADNSKFNENDEAVGTEKPDFIENETTKNDENLELNNENENQVDEVNIPNVESLENCADTENVPSNISEDNNNNNGHDNRVDNDEMALGDENIATSLQTNDDKNTTNVTEGEIVNDDNHEHINSDTNEANLTEIESPNDTEDQDEEVVEQLLAVG